jgi:F-type H+-transporting ATPase subunit b
MRGSRISAWSLWLVCGMLVFSSGLVRAEDKPKEVNKKYRALIHHAGEKLEEDEDFDLSKPEQFQRLTELLSKGEVAELQKEKEINILAINWDLGLWTLVVFALLLFVLRKLAWKPWLEGIHRREANIKGALAEAQSARAEAEQMRAELKKEMGGAQEKVRQLMEEARSDAQRAKDELVAHARAEIQGERERLQREIAMARDQALQELWSQTAQLATLISAKAIRRQLNLDDHRRLVDEAITELSTVRKTVGVS